MQLTQCPICDGEIIMRCRCLVSHQVCQNRHEWHYCQAHADRVVLESEKEHQEYKPKRKEPNCNCTPGKTFKMKVKLQKLKEV